MLLKPTNKGNPVVESCNSPEIGAAKTPGSIQVIERMMSLLDALAASPEPPA
jgi:hypothetical protein